MPHSSIESIPRNLSPSTYGAGFSLTRFRIFLSYAARSFLNKLKASACAGDSGFGSSKSDWMPNSISLIVIAGFQPSSSLRIERQTVPEGYTFGWKSGGTNLHLGGFVGYSSGNATSSLNSPPSQSVLSFPGTPQSHFFKSRTPWGLRMGFAKKPKG